LAWVLLLTCRQPPLVMDYDSNWLVTQPLLLTNDG